VNTTLGISIRNKTAHQIDNHHYFEPNKLVQGSGLNSGRNWFESPSGYRLS
jgi:hypothetical protein